METPSDSYIHLAPNAAGDVMASEKAASHDIESWSTLEIDFPFPALVRGLDADSCPFEEETALEWLSTHTLRLRLTRPVLPGTTLSVVIRLALDAGASTATSAPRVSIRGAVLNIEGLSDRVWRLTMGFKRHRFLYAA